MTKVIFCPVAILYIAEQKTMKKFALLFFSVSFLINSTELHELARIPILFEHFADHRSENNQLSLIGFLLLHYSASHPDDSDDNMDNELPFKPHGTLTHIDLTITPDDPSQKNNTENCSKKIRLFDEKIPISNLSGIFRPPKVV